MEEDHRPLKEQFTLEAIQVQKWNHLKNLVRAVGGDGVALRSIGWLAYVPAYRLTGPYSAG